MPLRLRRHSKLALASPLNDHDGAGSADGVAGALSIDGADGPERSSV